MTGPLTIECRPRWAPEPAEFFLNIDPRCSPRAGVYFSTPSGSCKRCATGEHHVSR